MSFTLTIIYDDRMPLPPDISEIIGAARYSNILCRRQSLGETVRKTVTHGGGLDFFHLVDDRDAHFLIDLIETSPANRLFLRLPSCMMSTRPDSLTAFIAQANYALGSILLMAPEDGEAAALLLAADVLPLLRARNSTTIRELLLRLAQSVPVMENPCGFADLRRPALFLEYMGNATETRSFNATRIERHIVRKSSTDRTKMEAEYRFFHVVPEALKPFLVPTFDFTDDGVRAGYAMERLAIPDAAVQLIHNAFDERSFAALLERFFDFIAARPGRPDGVKTVRETARQVILGKMQQRLARFLDTEVGRRLDALLLAAGPCGGLAEMGRRAGSLIEMAILRDGSSQLVIGHGDACFSNILFDRRIELIRLIDPRGARSLDEAWLHPLYDLAKFSHSVLGGYDFVNNDLFDCLLTADLRLKLSLQDDGPPAWAQALFLQKLEQGDILLFIVRAYELSLFLSMLPLHMDHPRKLVGFSLIAASLIHKLEEQR